MYSLVVPSQLLSSTAVLPVHSCTNYQEYNDRINENVTVGYKAAHQGQCHATIITSNYFQLGELTETDVTNCTREVEMMNGEAELAEK